uniref:Uncharacterized protein n=1 Tax=Anguilla anguilla TaxID=7936 RepID=A0A0E9SC52_ANGAN
MVGKACRFLKTETEQNWQIKQMSGKPNNTATCSQDFIFVTSCALSG